MAPSPLICETVGRAAEEIERRIGKAIMLGVPLGLGKPVELVNELYRRAVADGSRRLTILSALALERPVAGSKLERAFLDPFVKRVFGDAPELEYLPALHADRLPANVEVREFFLRPGGYLHEAHAQQHYISSNYTHAARDVAAQGCNVVAQMVARRGDRFSLSCNPDTGPELIERLRAAGRPVVSVAVVNANLPFMPGDAEVGAAHFDVIVDHARYATALFPLPKLAVSTQDYLIGLHASTLVRDGGTLQIGIGSLGDAIVYALQLRHRQNAVYRELLHACGAAGRHVAEVGGDAAFVRGLYGASEMFVDGFMHLQQAGILKRRVYDFWALQQLVNEQRCDPDALTPAVLDHFVELGVRTLRTHDFERLQHHGLFRDDARYDHGHIVAPGGERVVANLAEPAARAVIGEQCLGARLRHGRVLDAAFFLGPEAFYRWLRELPEGQRGELGMTRVARINQLDHNPRLYLQQRLHARFINTGLMATLTGAIVSDGLEDGQVISGVGGQYNFVAMAHQLQTGRSILLIRAVRGSGSKATSNIVFNYGHTTIPRHLRDIVVTEYGVADLRSKTDAEVIAAMIAVADARFQDVLADQAKAAGKLPRSYRVPDACRRNRPEVLVAALAPFRSRDLFPDFPLGTDFTPEEQVLAKVLLSLKTRLTGGKMRLLQLMLGALWPADIPSAARPYLNRLGLEPPASLGDWVTRRLVARELRRLGGRKTSRAGA